MSTHSNTTTDHNEIKEWVEKRKGKPARVKGTGSKNDPGLLRIDFPGNNDGALEEITWDEFFNKFDKENLAFAYQDQKVNGEISYFNKLVSREREPVESDR
jgi:hypothetical protein